MPESKPSCFIGCQGEVSGTESEMEDKDIEDEDEENNFKPDTLIANSSCTAHNTFPGHSNLYPDTCQEPSWSILEEEERSDDNRDSDKRNGWVGRGLPFPHPHPHPLT